jgi:hypothetical protein
MNTTGKKFGGRTKGTPNKLNSEIKDKLSSIINEAIDSFDIADMTKAERLKLIQLGMPYIITKPQQEEIQEQQNITVEIIDRLDQVTDAETDAAIDNYVIDKRTNDRNRMS